MLQKTKNTAFELLILRKYLSNRKTEKNLTKKCIDSYLQVFELQPSEKECNNITKTLPSILTVNKGDGLRKLKYWNQFARTRLYSEFFFVHMSCKNSFGKNL